MLVIKLKHSGNVWKKVIKQKYPGAVSTGARVKTDKKGRKDGKKSGEPALFDLKYLRILPDVPLGSKFSTTWRPVGDYIHLKVLFNVQDTTLQVSPCMMVLMLLLYIKVSGTSYILWAAENYQDCCKIADEIAAKEAEEET